MLWNSQLANADNRVSVQKIIDIRQYLWKLFENFVGVR